MRRRGVKRLLDRKKAERKKRISDRFGSPWYDCLGKYRKGKIHCSCPMCRCKTNARHGLPGPAMNWSGRDLRRLEAMRYDSGE